MGDTLQIIFGLFGGLAIFIFGMNMMSECLQKAAGDRMRKILSLLTEKPIMGALAGAVTTAVLQSSSATTVMAIGFVSAGLMTLPQAISIIFGANVGTTITAQITAFKISDYIYFFIMIGFFGSFAFKSQKIKNIGQTVFAFGLLFLGIETIGSVMKPLASSQFFIDMIGNVANIPVLGVMAGAFMTFIVQSSSATIAVLQNFASQPLEDGVTSIIGLAGAIPILLGDNIGTTITALLASVGQGKDARRTALAHCIFNISGSLIFLGILNPYTYLIKYISPVGNEVDVISRQIANAHTGFNLTMAFVWIPLIGFMVWMVTKLVPDKDNPNTETRHSIQYLDDKLLGQPVMALHLAFREIIRCGDLVGEMLMDICKMPEKDGMDVLKEVLDKSETEKKLNVSVHEYLATLCTGGTITGEQASLCADYMLLMCDIDRIGVMCGEMVQNIMGQGYGKKGYSKEALRDLKKSVGIIFEMYNDIMRSIAYGDDSCLSDIASRRKKVLGLDVEMRKSHIERIVRKKCNAKRNVGFNNILMYVDRIGNSCVNLADAAMSGLEFTHF